jgi:type IV pilus assembly protein PilA
MIKKLGLKLKEQKGFTLIELLAVIVILGIIAAIAIPSIGNVITKSKDNAKVAEAISIIDAARLSQADDTGTSTSSGTTTTTGSLTTTTWTSTSATSNQLSAYVSKVKDNVWVVTYNHTTKKFSITGHDAGKVVKSLADDAVAAAVITEDELAAKAAN